MEIIKARARRTDPSTSHEAAASIHDLSLNQRCVLRVLQRCGPLIDEELLEIYHRSPLLPKQSDSGIRSRRAALVKLGLVEYTGERKMMSTGRMAQIWKASDD